MVSLGGCPLYSFQVAESLGTREPGSFHFLRVFLILGLVERDRTNNLRKSGIRCDNFTFVSHITLLVCVIELFDAFLAEKGAREACIRSRLPQ